MGQQLPSRHPQSPWIREGGYTGTCVLRPLPHLSVWTLFGDPKGYISAIMSYIVSSFLNLKSYDYEYYFQNLVLYWSLRNLQQHAQSMNPPHVPRVFSDREHRILYYRTAHQPMIHSLRDVVNSSTDEEDYWPNKSTSVLAHYLVPNMA